MTLTGAGTVILQASEAADTNYAIATQNAAFTVGAITPTIPFTVPNVPTGINAGICTSPCEVKYTLRRAAQTGSPP